jgi:hypothetical protein
MNFSPGVLIVVLSIAAPLNGQTLRTAALVAATVATAAAAGAESRFSGISLAAEVEQFSVMVKAACAYEPFHGATELNCGPPSTGMLPLPWSCGTPTRTAPAQEPPLSSVTVKLMW